MTVEGRYVKLNVEKYGGMILSTWLDRPLSVAGRVVTAGKEAGIAESTVAVNRDLLIIPNVAIHMNREMNKGVEYNVQTDMLPLYAMEKEGNTLQELIASSAKAVPTHSAASSDRDSRAARIFFLISRILL